MNNIAFEQASDEEKLAMLSFIQAEEKALDFYFNEQANDYFKTNYPKECFGDGTIRLIGSDHKIHLFAMISEIKKEDSSIIVTFFKHHLGDADVTYDDSRVIKFTSYHYPDGMDFILPISIISRVSMCYSRKV